jgi:hypothetical protein
LNVGNATATDPPGRNEISSCSPADLLDPVRCSVAVTDTPVSVTLPVLSTTAVTAREEVGGMTDGAPVPVGWFDPTVADGFDVTAAEPLWVDDWGAVNAGTAGGSTLTVVSANAC